MSWRVIRKLKFRNISTALRPILALLSLILGSLVVIAGPSQALPEQYPVSSGSSIAQGDFHVCYITIDGSPDCWGRTQQAAAVPEDMGQAESIVAGADTTCVVTTQKDIRCWGANEFTRRSSNLLLQKTMVAVTKAGKVCFSITNEITCDGSKLPAMNMRANLTQLVAGSDFICVLNDENKVNCKEFDGGYIGDSAPFYIPSTLRLVEISAGTVHACGIDLTGQTTCWGSNSFGQAEVPSDLAKTSQVSAGNTHSCALSVLGKVKCWGSNLFGQLDVPENLGTVLEVSAGNARTCVVLAESGPRCWGKNYDSLTPPRDVIFTHVSTSNSHTCGISQAQDLFCWGSDSFGQADVPPNLGKVSKVVLSDFSTCVITIAAKPFCWGLAPQERVESVWWDLNHKPIKDISVYQKTICLINEDGQGGCDAPYYSGVSAIGISNSSECHLREVGTIDCSGFNWWGRHNVPANLTSVTQLSINGYGACALTTASFVTCWGFEGVQWGANYVSELPIGASFKEVKVGGKFACGINYDSKVQCWGGNEYGQTSVPDDLGSVVDISSSYNHSCAVSLIGEIDCWGLLENSQIQEPTLKKFSILRGLKRLPQPLISGFIRVGSTLEAVPGVWDSGVALTYQWLVDYQPIEGAVSKNYTPTPGDLGKYLTVNVTGSKPGYRSEISGSLGMGVEPGRMELTTDVEVIGVFRVGALLEAAPLAIDENYDVAFQWMRDNLPIPEATDDHYRVQPEDIGKTLRLRAVVSKVGYLGTRIFLSKAETVTLDVPDFATGAVIALGKEHGCFINKSAQPVCSLSESLLNDQYKASHFDFGQADVPTDLGSVTEVVAGDYHTCALIDLGTVRCWGSNEHGQSEVPEGVGNTIQISAAGENTCAVSKNGELTCWGDSEDNRLAIPENLGLVKSVAVGETHSCAIGQSDELVRCWGNNYSGQLDVPLELGPVNQVAVGLSHTCAINLQGNLRCWGSNLEGQLNPPENIGSVVQVSAGWAHNCAVTVEVNVVCWGSNYAFESEVPTSGLFSQLVSNGQTSCGLYSDNEIDNLAICWGVNDDLSPWGVSLLSPASISEDLVLQLGGADSVGSTLTLTITNQEPGHVQVVNWMRAGIEIPEAHGNTYKITIADVNQVISAKVQSYRSWHKSKSIVSQGILIKPLKMTVGVKPRISGTPIAGKTVKAVCSAWVKGAKLSFQWFVDGKAVKAANRFTFSLPKTSKGKSVYVVVYQLAPGYEKATSKSLSIKIRK